MTRLHKGKDYEQFIWRDLVGRYRQGNPYKIPRWVVWNSILASGSIVTWLNTNHPTSDECLRQDMLAAWGYEWSVTVPSVGDVLLSYQMTLVDPDQFWRLDLSARWGANHAEADVTWHDDQLIEAIPPMHKPLFWDHVNSTQPSRWNWGPIGSLTYIELGARGYPYP